MKKLFFFGLIFAAAYWLWQRYSYESGHFEVRHSSPETEGKTPKKHTA